jgi:parallel beta-helix repeat protein
MFRTSLSQALRRSRKTKVSQRRSRVLSIDSLEDRRMLSTLFVDDDHAQMHNAAFTTIQAAVNAAKPGDTIRVAPGTYEESVTVDKKLTILGAQTNTREDQNRGRGENDDKHDRDDHGHGNNSHNAVSRASIVESPAAGTAGFNLTANDIVIRGFTIEDSDDNGVSPVGIVTSRDTSGDTIANNIIESNTFGIYLNTNGAHRTIVQNNLIRDNNQAGSASGNGIYSDQGASNVVNSHNFFTGQTNASIIFVGGGPLGPATNQSGLTITGNAMVNDAPIILVNTTNSQISNNFMTGSVGSGIFLGGGVSGLTIRGNTLLNGAFTGINLRTDTFGNASTPNTNIQIVSNTISGWGDAGIRLSAGASNVLVSRNNVSRNATDGITLEGAVNNRIEQNILQSNRQDGIHADAASMNNVFTRNDARRNVKFDYEDNSVGTGTAGTANTWTRNKGRTASPPGLIG